MRPVLPAMRPEGRCEVTAPTPEEREAWAKLCENFRTANIGVGYSYSALAAMGIDALERTLAALDAAEKERDELRRFKRDQLEPLRALVKAALPKWPWDDPEHDPLHAHPVEQRFATDAEGRFTATGLAPGRHRATFTAQRGTEFREIPCGTLDSGAADVVLREE